MFKRTERELSKKIKNGDIVTTIRFVIIVLKRIMAYLLLIIKESGNLKGSVAPFVEGNVAPMNEPLH